MTQHRITSVHFSNYKAFSDFSLSLKHFNVLVGPNNAGKSTILGAFRILSEAIRKAKAKSPSLIEGPSGVIRGYDINLSNIPVATENVFHNYDESVPAIIKFRISNGNFLNLIFPAPNVCQLYCETSSKAVTSPSSFKSAFPIEIGFVPILGPVEHNEQLFQKDAAREALLSHRASRNFRNIWYHFPENFEEFRELIQSTWPGMNIQEPEVDTSHDKPMLRMFCPEERFLREIFWSGFGFQVWCQMLTFIIAGKSTSLLLIDEPDIYLHSDLQRQLITILRSLGPDILIATHSTEIISETDPHNILVISKNTRSAKQVKNSSSIREIFQTLGSNANPVLTQLAKSKRLVFVEGKDFQIISRFASKLSIRSIATRTDFAVIAAEGYNPAKAKFFIEGVEATLGEKLSTAIIFDKDYRSEQEIKKETKEFEKFCKFTHIHSCKEIENFLLIPSALEKAIKNEVDDRNTRSGKSILFVESIIEILDKLTNEIKANVYGQLQKRMFASMKEIDKSIDPATISAQIFLKFEEDWKELEKRLKIVPGKEVLTRLNTYLQSGYGVTITTNSIIEAMLFDEIPAEIKIIIDGLVSFIRSTPILD